MPPLVTIRKGWENEKLAAYLLSRFSFVAQPTSVGDDVGSDFFCTIFQISEVSGRDVLLPRSSFGVQVKSSLDEVPFDNKIDYLMGLELPFFIAVVRQDALAMDIYSAEFLPLLFSQIGRPDRLSLVPVAASEFSPSQYYEAKGTKIQLRCPLVTTIRAEDDRAALTPKVESLLRICTRAQGNIATRVGEEHIYKIDDGENVLIVAGSGSARYFRDNLTKRLAEAFYNLNWLTGVRPAESLIAEFQAYERFYRELETVYERPLPLYVKAAYLVAKSRLGL